MHDEYRVRVDTDPAQANALLRALHEIEAGVDPTHRVAVTRDGGELFLYADSSEAAEQARAEVERAMTAKSLQGDVTVSRWHPLEERWEDASAPLPATDADRAAEHRRLQETEAAESAATGVPEWEIRVTLATHHDAREFAERLLAEGIPVVRRWRHVMVGAANEDQAKSLAERLRREAPEGSTLEVEGAGQEIWAQLHPYSVFGGIAN